MTGPATSARPTEPTTTTSTERTPDIMPDLDPARQRQLARLQPVLFRLMAAGALADVIELLTELDRFATRESPARNMSRPTAHHPVSDSEAPWERLITPEERRQADQHDSEPHGLAVTRSLDVLESWLAGAR